MIKNLRQLQLKEYKMLIDVVSFCDRHNIKYFLIAGTLLGAMRHGGFIPWDDDIDIGMDLKNYNKFLKISKKQFPDGYFVQNIHSEPKINTPWTKIRINGTTSMDPRLTNYEIHLGICMDIFLINGISDNQFKKKLQLFCSKNQRKLMKKYYHLEGNGTGNCKRINRILPEFVRRFLIRCFDSMINIDISKTKYCYNTFFEGVGYPFKYESDWFKNLKKIKFEDEWFYSPCEPKKYLEARYGDWQTPPPASERIGHGEIIIDLDKDYSEYRNI